MDILGGLYFALSHILSWLLVSFHELANLLASLINLTDRG